MPTLPGPDSGDGDAADPLLDVDQAQAESQSVQPPGADPQPSGGDSGDGLPGVDADAAERQTVDGARFCADHSQGDAVVGGPEILFRVPQREVQAGDVLDVVIDQVETDTGEPFRIADAQTVSPGSQIQRLGAGDAKVEDQYGRYGESGFHGACLAKWTSDGNSSKRENG